MSRPTFSIVVPVYNERESLPELYRRVRAVMESLGEPWELVLVDDGSTDGSTDLIRELHRQDPEHVRPVIFARNFGHQIAVTAGMDYARGCAVIIMDADLQDPPEVIPDLIARWREGYDVVYAVRVQREGESWFKKATAALFYRLIYRITDVPIPLDTGDFRLIDRKVLAVLRRMRERHRFIRGMAAWVGFRQIGVPYRRAPRYAGETKYPLRKMLKFALDAITSFSYFPLQLATYLGFVSAGLSILAIPLVAVARLTGSQAFYGQATTLIAVLFLGGVQLISLGILGEYVGRIYDEVKGRPLYVVAEAANSPSPESDSYAMIEEHDVCHRRRSGASKSHGKTPEEVSHATE
ncbi:MAG: glycosyltransferase family 2 protein [Chloroflexi bacterium]|nr:glycosyltransferase family 2 protein [Chloroflexota bacterium]